MKINHICTLLLLFSTWCHLAVAGTCSELLVSPIPKYTVTTIPGTKVRLVNLGPAVRQFVTLAKDLPYEEQEKLWLELIEKNHLYFYRHMVWGNQPGEINRKAFLESLFKNDFFAQAPAMLEEFATFNEKATAQVYKFLKFFRDAHLPQYIYAAPAINFDGKASRSFIVGFGIDRIIQQHANLDVLFAHELTHIYHAWAAKRATYIPQDSVENLLETLWKEGIAVYNSQVMNPTASAADIFMSEELAKINSAGIKDLAQNFLSDLRFPFGTVRELHAKWFQGTSSMNHKSVPVRGGYRLGYEVIKSIAFTHNLSPWQMAHLDYQQIRDAMLDTITYLAHQ